MKQYNFFLTCFIVVLSVYTYASPAEENKFLELLRNETDVNKIYNEINNIEWSNANLDMVHDIWRKNLNKYPDIPRDKVNNDIVRLALANVLMQAKRHCRINNANIDELHNFVLSKTRANDLSVRGRATYLLGLAGYNKDIPFLSSIVESEEEGYAEEAALSITFIHSEAALDAIRTLLGKVKRKSLQVFLKDIIEKYQAYPLLEYSKGCEQENKRNEGSVTTEKHSHS